IGGVIGGTGNLVINSTFGSTNTVTLNAINTYTGSTTVRSGTLTLGSTSRLASTSYLIGPSGTLKLDNDGLTTIPDRIPDTASITLAGGTFFLQGSTAADTTETVGTITAAAGHSVIQSLAGGTHTVQLIATELDRN